MTEAFLMWTHPPLLPCFRDAAVVRGRLTVVETFYFGPASPPPLPPPTGTLAPLQSFAAESRLSFPLRLEYPHVIGSDQARGGGGGISILEGGYISRKTHQ